MLHPILYSNLQYTISYMSTLDRPGGGLNHITASAREHCETHEMGDGVQDLAGEVAEETESQQEMTDIEE